MGLRGPLPRIEHKAAAPASLEAPGWLNSEAAAHWHRHADYLVSNGLLTSATADAWAIHCDLYGRMMEGRGKLSPKAYHDFLKAWNASSRIWHLVPTDKPGGTPEARHAAKAEFDFE